MSLDTVIAEYSLQLFGATTVNYEVINEFVTRNLWGFGVTLIMIATRTCDRMSHNYLILIKYFSIYRESNTDFKVINLSYMFQILIDFVTILDITVIVYLTINFSLVPQ